LGSDFRLVGPAIFLGEIRQAIIWEAGLAVVLSFAANLLILRLHFKTWRRVWLVMLPVTVGTVFTVGAMGILRLPFNFFNVWDRALFSFGVDYGICVQALRSAGAGAGSIRAGRGDIALCRRRYRRRGSLITSHYLSPPSRRPLSRAVCSVRFAPPTGVPWPLTQGTSRDAAVIGSGSGVWLRGRLAARGRAWSCWSKRQIPAGTNSFSRFRLTRPWTVSPGSFGCCTLSAQAWAAACAHSLDPASAVPGLTCADASLPAYLDRLCGLFPAERDGIAAFFRRAEEIYADVARMMEAVADPSPMAPPATGALMRHGHLTYADLLRLDIRDRRLAAVLSDRCPFLGVSPMRASATRMVSLIMSYFRSGAFRPRGGHQRIPDLLVHGIRRRGGEVHLGRSATAIRLEGDRCDRVVTADGAEFLADHVVSNGRGRDFAAWWEETWGGGQRAR
jgi:hypothetical protein